MRNIRSGYAKPQDIPRLCNTATTEPDQNTGLLLSDQPCQNTAAES